MLRLGFAFAPVLRPFTRPRFSPTDPQTWLGSMKSTSLRELGVILGDRFLSAGPTSPFASSFASHATATIDQSWQIKLLEKDIFIKELEAKLAMLEKDKNQEIFDAKLNAAKEVFDAKLNAAKVEKELTMLEKNKSLRSRTLS